MSDHIEQHPLAPFLPENAQLLMLGSFPPPQARWKMDFYYPNFQNDMWRIFGLIFFDDKHHFIDVEQKSFKEQGIRDFLSAKKIAIYDMAEQVIRLKNNAADQYLQIVQATDIPRLLQSIPHCRSILTTGDKATETLLSVLPQGTIKPTLQQSSTAIINQQEIGLHRLPSSSRAYPLALEKKAQAYADFFRKIGLL
jgi:G:T/U-mismatch repair DNA glycosylase